MLEWNVFLDNVSGRKIGVHNIFNHYGFAKELKKILKEYGEDRDAFLEEVRKSMMYYYWAKCEWEVIVSEWPPREKNGHEEKIDVYDQVQMNWDRFCEYLWANKAEIKKLKI